MKIIAGMSRRLPTEPLRSRLTATMRPIPSGAVDKLEPCRSRIPDPC